ncbi:MAG: hypothetical protein ACYS0K_18140, partial [Planctomycetota bacterium]
VADTDGAPVPPAPIDLGRAGDVEDSVIQTDGNTVAVYMDIDNHIYYNEFDGTRWRTQDGLPSPALVDHDSSVNVQDFAVLDASACRGCSTIHWTPVIWRKRDFSDPERRLNVRVRR